jgi:cysteine-rich repeat protein
VEECDDGNTVSGDGCENDCHFTGLCGDGAVQPPEVCDDGNHVNTDDCIACQAAFCGDGFLRTTPVSPANVEECDDGNTVPGDGCNGDCTFGCTSDAECTDADACTVNFCDLSSHLCATRPADDGIACGGGTICTGMGTCLGGVCIYSIPPDCNDYEACTTDTCDPTGGCVHTELAEGTSCDDGLFCLTGERCRRGLDLRMYCTAELGTSPCNDGNACTEDTCDEATDSCNYIATTYRDVACGTEMRGDAMRRPNEYHDIVCPGRTWTATGADTMQQVAVTTAGTLTVTVNTAESATGTTVFIMSVPCSASACLGGGGTTASATVTPGTYYILVDSTVDGGPYVYDVTCP